MAADGIYADLHFEGMFVLLMCLISSPKKDRDRATQLGYPEDQCVVQLFITGSLEDNPHPSGLRPAWFSPQQRYKLLFEPFGNSLIQDLMKINSREKPECTGL